MAKRKPRYKFQGIDFVVGGYRKIVRDPKASIAQRMKALDRLAVMDGILSIPLIEPNDVTRLPSTEEVEVDTDRVVRGAIAEIMKAAKTKVEESQNGIPRSREEADTSVRESVG